MVRTLLILLSLAQARSVYAEAFKMECSSHKIYFGESFYCDFFLYADTPMAEVEVAKFPEFRGYWKENTMLRQGRIALAPDSPQPFNLTAPKSSTVNPAPRLRRALIASYRLTPMIGEPNPEIKPMKLVINYPYLGGKQQTLYSEWRPLTLLDIPEKNRPSTFNGAVGRFKLSAEDGTYETKNPSLIRYHLYGDGNFEEIDTLPIEFPKTVEILNRHSFGDGLGTRQSRTFEWTVSISGDDDVELPPLTFWYFDPQIGRFEKATSGPLKLKHVRPFEEVALTPPKKLTLAGPDLHWTFTHSLFHAPLFYLSQLSSLLLLLSFLVWRLLNQRMAAHLTSDAYLREKRWEAIQSLSEDERFLKEMHDLAHDYLKVACRVSGHGHTNRELLEIATRKFPDPELANRARIIFANYERHLFSPSPNPSVDRTELTQALNYLKRLAS